jgi:ABC-type glutathione transport system ATPase component
VALIADRVAVMERGRVIETGATEAVLFGSTMRGTRAMLAAVPTGRPRRRAHGALDDGPGLGLPSAAEDGRVSAEDRLASSTEMPP